MNVGDPRSLLAAANKHRRLARQARSRARRSCAIVCTLLVSTCALAQDASELRNWFNDPHFQVRHAIADCPVPLGPLITQAEMRSEAHDRSQRGTSCWLEGKCGKPNSYLYDAGIADAVRARFADSHALPDASLWITVQRRIVLVEGCLARATPEGTVEALLRDVPDVEGVTLKVTRDPTQPPYRTAGSGATR